MKRVTLTLVLLTAACSGAPVVTRGPARVDSYAGEPAPDLARTTRPSEPVALVGGTVMTADGRILEGGTVVISEGRIQAVTEAAAEPPPGARIIDVTDRFVTPGIIDTHSHMGVYPVPSDPALADGNEMTSPATPDVRAESAFWPQDPQLERALAGGITTFQVLPGSGNVIGGRGVTMKTRPGISARALRFEGAPWGLKMACGENPRRVYGEKGQRPMTRMGSAAILRERFVKAREYMQGRERWADAVRAHEEKGRPPAERPEEPPRDLALETLAAAMRGQILVHVHCYRADEMLQMLELADELGFRIRSFHHAVEAYKIRDVLAAQGVATSTWADWWGFKLEAHDAIVENAGLLSEAGALAIIHSDSGVAIQRLNQDAAKAMAAARRAGIAVSDDEALRWITANAAWALGISDQTGRLAEGLAADVVVWSAHPFSIYAEPDLVFVDGVLEHDRARATAPRSDFELGAPR
jgi:imidazolonepropionase-like amidohydrolase